MSCKRNRFALLPLVALLCLGFALSLSGCGMFGGKKPVHSGSGTYRPYTVHGEDYTPLQSAENYNEEGLCSWYGDDFHGKSTASGETYNMHDLTAAHKILPMNTRVRVTNLNNGRQTVVRINDRGPFVSGRVIDVSRKAAEELDIIIAGTAPVRIETLDVVPGYNPDGGGDMPGRFFIQIGSFTVRQNADSLLASMRRRYSGSRLQEVLIGGKRFWRVQLGAFNGLAAARRELPSLQANYPSSFVIAD